jgi:hypothetical protein
VPENRIQSASRLRFTEKVKRGWDFFAVTSMPVRAEPIRQYFNEFLQIWNIAEIR